jgi:hypothetical protein
MNPYLKELFSSKLQFRYTNVNIWGLDTWVLISNTKYSVLSYRVCGLIGKHINFKFVSHFFHDFREVHYVHQWWMLVFKNVKQESRIVYMFEVNRTVKSNLHVKNGLQHSVYKNGERELH